MMSISKVCIAILVAAPLALTVSCSNNEDSNENGAIRKSTDKIAQEATEMIKNPINEAKEVVELSTDRAHQFEEATTQE